MTPDDFRAKMLALSQDFRGDAESFHGHADTLLCEALRSLGYGEGVDIFERMEKWYA